MVVWRAKSRDFGNSDGSGRRPGSKLNSLRAAGKQSGFWGGLLMIAQHSATLASNCHTAAAPTFARGNKLALAGFAAIVCATAATPLSAQTLTHKDISVDAAVVIATTAMAECKAKGYRVSVAVVGRSGELILHMRGDGTGPHTMDNSFRKAYTARTFRSPSGNLAKRLKENPQLSLVTLPNVVAAQGALPIKIGDDVVGAAGASGAPGGEKDEACIKAGLDKIADKLK
jgi:uncharacterized protein GlcG (DUF336 family)